MLTRCMVLQRAMAFSTMPKALGKESKSPQAMASHGSRPENSPEAATGQIPLESSPPVKAFSQTKRGEGNSHLLPQSQYHGAVTGGLLQKRTAETLSRADIRIS